MATRLPVDGSQMTFIATGKFRPVREYAELADGSRRAIPDSQSERDGVPVWTVDVQLVDDESDRDQAVGIKVASASKPEPPQYGPVTFSGLVCTPYVDRRTNRIGLSFSATGMTTVSNGSARKVAAEA